MSSSGTSARVVIVRGSAGDCDVVEGCDCVVEVCGGGGGGGGDDGGGGGGGM